MSRPPSENPLQYALLAHTVEGETHFDLLLELPGEERLRTLRLAGRLEREGDRCRVEEIAPHRRLYLTFEGEIPGGRGMVERLEEGTWRPDAGDMVLFPLGGRPWRLRIAAGHATRSAGEQKLQ